MYFRLEPPALCTLLNSNITGAVIAGSPWRLRSIGCDAGHETRTKLVLRTDRNTTHKLMREVQLKRSPELPFDAKLTPKPLN